MGGTRYWLETISIVKWPNIHNVTYLHDTFAITILSDTSLNMRGDVMAYAGTDSSSHAIFFEGTQSSNTLYYYPEADSIVYTIYGSVADTAWHDLVSQGLP